MDIYENISVGNTCKQNSKAHQRDSSLTLNWLHYRGDITCKPCDVSFDAEKAFGKT